MTILSLKQTYRTAIEIHCTDCREQMKTSAFEDTLESYNAYNLSHTDLGAWTRPEVRSLYCPRV